jgi:glycosyltransferase involved in cell wall biosynthesis
MDIHPLVTCIVPVFNAEAHLADAVESVFAQGYGRWELLLIDLGATDASGEIASRFAAAHPDRVHYHVRATEQDPTTARYLEWAQRARGEYVAFLEPTDVWLPRKLEQQVSILRADQEIAMVYGKPLVWHSWTGKMEDRHLDYTCEVGVESNLRVAPPGLVPLLLHNQYETATVSDTLLRSKAVCGLGRLPLEAALLPGASALFAALMLSAPVFVSDQCWTRRRRVTAAAFVTTENRETSTDRVRFLQGLKALFLERQVGEPAIWRALDDQFINYSYDRVIGAIRRRFPELDVRHMVFLGEGLTSRTYRVNHEFIFRFPKHRAAREALRVEIGLLDLLRDHLPLPIPRLEFINEERSNSLTANRFSRVHARLMGKSARVLRLARWGSGRWASAGNPLGVFVGYKEIRGSMLYPEFLVGLPESSRKRLAGEVGQFLRALHHFPLDLARRIGVRERSFDWSYYEGVYRSIEARLFPRLTSGQRRVLEGYFAATQEASGEAGRHCALLHGDLNWSHLLFDEQAVKIAGVIDFGAVFIGDPAYDFLELLHKYDPGFLRLVLEAYGARSRSILIDRLILLHCERMIDTAVQPKEDLDEILRINA